MLFFVVVGGGTKKGNENKTDAEPFKVFLGVVYFCCFILFYFYFILFLLIVHDPFAIVNKTDTLKFHNMHKYVLLSYSRIAFLSRITFS